MFFFLYKDMNYIRKRILERKRVPHSPLFTHLMWLISHLIVYVNLLSPPLGNMGLVSFILSSP